MLLFHKIARSSARLLKHRHGLLTLLAPCTRPRVQILQLEDLPTAQPIPPVGAPPSMPKTTQGLQRQKHEGQALTSESIAQLRQLDRAACVMSILSDSAEEVVAITAEQILRKEIR